MDPDTALLSLAAIVRHCREESANHLLRRESDERFCRELLRRALCDRDQAAWAAVFAQYRNLVVSWLRRHPAHPYVGEDDDFWLNRTFERFWVAVSPDRFAAFPTLGALLGYLQRCADSVLEDAARRLRHRPQPATGADTTSHLSATGAGPEAVMDDVHAEALWAAICAETQDQAEATIARLSFLQDLKPREIYAWHPELFASVAEVYRIKRNLVERLRRNPAIQTFLDDE